MTREISVPLPDGSTLKFDWEGKDEPSNDVIEKALEMAGQTKFGASIPKPLPQPSWVEPGRISAELIGLLGGSAPGLLSANPPASVLGAGLGYAGMKNAYDYVLERAGVKKPIGILERMSQLGKDVPTGMATQAAGEVLPPVISGIGKIASYPWGAYTGVGATSIQQASKGGKNFTDYMRGQGSVENLIQRGKSALEDIEQTRNLEFDDIVSKLQGAGYSFQKQDLLNVLGKSVKQYDIKFYPSGLPNWSNTPYLTNPIAQNEIETAMKTIRQWGDYSPMGIQNLKRAIDNLWKRSQPEASAFISNLRNGVKDLLTGRMPEYADAMSKYKVQTSEIQEIIKDLGLGDLNTKRQTLTRVLNLVKKDDDFGLAILNRLDPSLVSSIAGMQMSAKIPMSLVGKMGGLYQIIRGVTNISFPEWMAIAASSPRLAGEFLNVFGKLARPMVGLSRYAPQATQVLAKPEKND